MMVWKKYENEVANYVRMKFGGGNILQNIKRPGKLSGTPREIDILIERQIADQYVCIVIECKKWKSKIDVADVGLFIDKLRDLNYSRGMMISEKGFTEAAFTRAMQESDLQLYVLDFTELSDKIGFWANPYNGQCGAFISAPSGWVIDAALPPEMKEIGQCALYPMGMKLIEAAHKRHWMYFNIVPLGSAHGSTIQAVFDKQDQAVLMNDPGCGISYWRESTDYGELLFRELFYKNDGYVEYSVGLETDLLVAYLVLTAPHELKERNLAKLRYMMSEIHFVALQYTNPKDSHRDWQEFLQRGMRRK